MQIRRVDALVAYMRSVIRTNETRSIETWSIEALRGVYIAATHAGISFEHWCEQMDYQIEPEGGELLLENELALNALRDEASQGAPVLFAEPQDASISNTSKERFDASAVKP